MTDRIATPRRRNRSTATASGTRLERTVADSLAGVWQSSIDRKVKTGSKDQGDIGGMTVGGNPVVIECKNVRSMSLGTWWAEARKEAMNLAAVLYLKKRPVDRVHAIVVHKRHGMAAGLDQWVTMPLWQLMELLEDAGAQR
jgi:hypothetical protein